MPRGRRGEAILAAPRPCVSSQPVRIRQYTSPELAAWGRAAMWVAISALETQRSKVGTLALPQGDIKAVGTQGGYPVEAVQRHVALDGGEFEGECRQRLREAGQHRILEALNVNLGKRRRAEPGDRRIERRARDLDLRIPHLPLPAARAVGGADEIGRGGGDRGVDGVDAKGKPARPISAGGFHQRHLAVVPVKRADRPRAQGLRFQCHHPRPEPAEAADAVAHMRAEVNASAPAARSARRAHPWPHRAPDCRSRTSSERCSAANSGSARSSDRVEASGLMRVRSTSLHEDIEEERPASSEAGAAAPRRPRSGSFTTRWITRAFRCRISLTS